MTPCKTYQQGDVLLVREKIPEKAKEVPPAPLATGENHHEHVLVCDPQTDVKYFHLDGNTYLEVLGDAVSVVHRQTGGAGGGEHGTVTLPRGTYRVGRVQEWDPWAQEARRVID